VFSRIASGDAVPLRAISGANTLFNNPVSIAFDSVADVTAITMIGTTPLVLLAHPSVPANSLKELIALAQAKPDSLTFGTSGSGTASHLAAELFNSKAASKIVAVHYQGGSSQAVTDLLAGRITLMFNVAATLAPHIAAGKLKAIAVAQQKRSAIMPDVPTMSEAGTPGFDAGIWMGLLAPASTPPDIVEKLSASANEALKSEMVQAALRPQGIDSLGGGPAEFSEFIRADIDKWTAILAATGLRKQ